MNAEQWDSLTEEEQDVAYRTTLLLSQINQEYYKQRVIELGKNIGYGNMMHLARDAWREKLARTYPGTEGGEFAVGPCVALTEPCDCEQRHKCDWCCGCGWVTRKVKELQEAA